MPSPSSARYRTVMSPRRSAPRARSVSIGCSAPRATAVATSSWPSPSIASSIQPPDLDPGVAAARTLSPDTATSSLGDQLGLGVVDEDELHSALDWLAVRQPAIQAALAKRHLTGGTPVLFDVSSSYMEGRCCPLAQFGYSRDAKGGKLQIVYGLLCAPDGWLGSSGLRCCPQRPRSPPDSEALRSSVVAKAERSPAAVTKQTTGRTEDGLPVHRFRTVLDDLATLTRDPLVTAIAPRRPFTLTARPTPLQQKAHDLLGLTRTQ